MKVTKKNFAKVGLVVLFVCLFLLNFFTQGLIYACIIGVGTIAVMLCLNKVIPWIESKLPEE